MKNYLRHHPWQIIEEGFHPDFNEVSESCFGIGNGNLGQRAFFEERFSGDSLPGSYVAGVYHSQKIAGRSNKKIGEPEQLDLALHAPNWIGIDVFIAGEVLDLATARVKNFKRVLNMKEGYLERSFNAKLVSGKEVKVEATRFCSLERKEVCAIRYAVTPLNFDGPIKITPYLDASFDAANSKLEENPWRNLGGLVKKRSGYLTVETHDPFFRVCVGMKYEVLLNRKPIELHTKLHHDEKYVGSTVEVPAKRGETIVVQKYVGVVSSRDHPKQQLMERCQETLQTAYKLGFIGLLKEQSNAWAEKWKEADVVVEGDMAAQQGIRFCIFQLNQTYAGTDVRLNIPAKGFTAPFGGGGAQWGMEAFCLPFFLATSKPEVARNLLLYRYKHLKKAIERAANMGLGNGAALYPRATMNGKESHPDRDLVLGAIHRNGAVAHAVFNYVSYTGDTNYLATHGLETLIAISRFWVQRCNWSTDKGRYVILGVVGPNEFENNVNNNWYTNLIARWSLRYTLEALAFVKKKHAPQFAKLCENLALDLPKETEQWEAIAEQMYLPEDAKRGIFPQHDGYLDKKLLTVDDIPVEHLPISRHWTWDRILRSNFVRQADVMLGLYLFEKQFDQAAILHNFEFYEPRTLHESSLSPSVHATVAARLGKHDKAQALLTRSLRFDLDDLNNDTADGLHIPSMASTWLAVVQGCGGMRAEEDMLSFDPHLPAGWEGFSFKIHWRGHALQLKVTSEEASIKNLTGKKLKVRLNGEVKRFDMEKEKGKQETP